MTQDVHTDYLVVGAGAAGMGIVDELLTHSNATITIVDRRHAPGGHWVDAYPYVRLHQPSTFYGVSSMLLGEDARDGVGTNAGFYELAGADEIRAYYQRLMTRRFLPSGRVRVSLGCDFQEPDRIVSRVTGETWRVRVARKHVDARYLEGTIPATSPPPFEVAEGVRCVAAGELVHAADRPQRYVLIGGGKTGLDAAVWLLERGVPADHIRWIRPREAWWINRRFQQPHEGVVEFYRGIALQIEALAGATSLEEVFSQLESRGFFLRIDPTQTPTMFRGAVTSEAEIELLRKIDGVVRLGHVQRIEPERIVLEQGSVPTTPDTVHVHCASKALARAPLRPIFEKKRITVQPFQWGFVCFQYATLGYLEATIESDEAKNRLCPPVAYWDANEDFVSTFLAAMMFAGSSARHPELAQWIKTSRFNPASGIKAYRNDPVATEARETIKRLGLLAAMNGQKLLAAAASGAGART